MNRRTSAFLCLLLSAVLLIALPNLLEGLLHRDDQRMAQRLRPQKAQTLTVWLMQDSTGSQKHLSQQIAQFEKKNPGVRVFLRKADRSDLTALDPVLPDALLFGPGALQSPAKILLPLVNLPGVPGDALLCGQSGGAQYAVPLWTAPMVLAIPAQWMPSDGVSTPVPTASSFFDLSTPAPTVEENGEDSPPKEQEIPWEELIKPGALKLPQGIALTQLLSMCPNAMRPALATRLAAQESASTPIPSQGKQAQGTAPKVTPSPAVAQVMPLAAYQAATASGQPLYGFAMTPATTQNVMLMGLCRGNDLAKAFLAHMLSEEAQAALAGHSLLPTLKMDAAPLAEALYGTLWERCQKGVLFPNAFEHTAQELNELCRDGFLRNVDPVETLLRLR